MRGKWTSSHHHTKNCWFCQIVTSSPLKKLVHDERLSLVTNKVCTLYARASQNFLQACSLFVGQTIWCDGVSHVCFEVLFSPHRAYHALRLQCTMYHCAHCATCSSLLCSSWIHFWGVTYISLSPYSIVIVAFNMLTT